MKHDCESLECPCQPEFERVCPECDGGDGKHGCWMCSGDGTVPCGKTEAEYLDTIDEAVLVIHREAL